MGVTYQPNVNRLFFSQWYWTDSIWVKSADATIKWPLDIFFNTCTFTSFNFAVMFSRMFKNKRSKHSVSQSTIHLFMLFNFNWFSVVHDERFIIEKRIVENLVCVSMARPKTMASFFCSFPQDLHSPNVSAFAAMLISHTVWNGIFMANQQKLNGALKSSKYRALIKPLNNHFDVDVCVWVCAHKSLCYF